MRIPILLPDLISDSQPIEFGNWLVDVGEAVLEGDRVAEVLNAGVLVYVAAPANGTLVEQSVQPGQELSSCETIGAVEPDEDARDD